MNKKNIKKFLEFPLALDLIHECFSQGDNLLQVILNLGDEDDDDEEGSDSSSSSYKQENLSISKNP